MSKNSRKKTSREAKEGANPNHYRHPTATGVINEEDTTFGLDPGLGFDHPFFQQPNPFTIKTSSALPQSPGRASSREVPPNVSHGRGPMGPTFCRADYRFDAPNLKGLTNYIHAQNVMIGSNNSMNISYHGSSERDMDFDDDSDSDDSSSEEDPSEKLRKEVESKKQEEERFEKKARSRATLESSRPISEEEMRAVSKCLFGAWKKFLRQLDIDDEVLDKFYQDYMGKGGLAEVVYQSLDYWRQNTDSPEVQKVAKALGHVSMWKTVEDHLHP